MRSARWGKGSVECGNPIAATKCAWKAGSIAVSIFSIRAVVASTSTRASADSSAISEPRPAALPTASTWSRSQSGISPSTMAYAGSMWLPNAPVSRISSTASTPRWSISSRQPAWSAALASWIARTSAWVTSMTGSSHNR